MLLSQEIILLGQCLSLNRTRNHSLRRFFVEIEFVLDTITDDKMSGFIIYTVRSNQSSVAPFLIARAQTKMLQNLIDGQKCFSYLYVMCHFSKSTEVSNRHTFRTWLGNETFFTTGNENILYSCGEN
jgi:hypothetical protein